MRAELPHIQPPSFRICTESADGTITVLPQGELDLATAPELTLALSRACASAAHAVILNLRDVCFLDVSAMRAILRAGAYARSAGAELLVVECPRPVQRVFELCRTIYPEIDALALCASA